MPEPFKLLYNPGLITTMADHFERTGIFDRETFLNIALKDLDALEMMQRAGQITDALDASLPRDFSKALPALYSVLHPETEAELSDLVDDAHGLRGWSLTPIGTFVARNGLAQPNDSLTYLREMTMRSSSEFAVRPFFRDHSDLACQHMKAWTQDANFHVRRLASEGSRPRLPWGIRLQDFVADPTPLLAMLKALRDDNTEYVRRSVANNLNDIAKDHPDLVAEIAGDWMQNASRNRARLVKHACRSLIKSGHKATLAVFGYGPPNGLRAALTLDKARIVLGDTLAIHVELINETDTPCSALVDLVAGFRKADGALGPKVFKWTETKVPANGTQILTKNLPLKPVTTRRHYPGGQSLSLQINGVVLAETTFDLDLP